MTAEPVKVWFSDLTQTANWSVDLDDYHETGEVPAARTIRAYKDPTTKKWVEDAKADELIATPEAQREALNEARRNAKVALAALRRQIEPPPEAPKPAKGKASE